MLRWSFLGAVRLTVFNTFCVWSFFLRCLSGDIHYTLQHVYFPLSKKAKCKVFGFFGLIFFFAFYKLKGSVLFFDLDFLSASLHPALVALFPGPSNFHFYQRFGKIMLLGCSVDVFPVASLDECDKFCVFSLLSFNWKVFSFISLPPSCFFSPFDKYRPISAQRQCFNGC